MARPSFDTGMPTHALVLAGGFSKRMGEDKNWVDFNGEPMLQSVLRRHRQAGMEFAIICHEEDGEEKRYLTSQGEEEWKHLTYRWLGEGLPWTCQMWQKDVEVVGGAGDKSGGLPFRHPVVGINGLLGYALRDERCNLAMLTSNDVPLMDSKLVEVLASQLEEEGGGVMPQMQDGSPAPLLSLVRPKQLFESIQQGHQDVMEALLSGRKAKSAIEVMLDAGVKIVTTQTLRDGGVDLSRLEGANTPEELELLKRRWLTLKL